MWHQLQYDAQRQREEFAETDSPAFDVNYIAAALAGAFDQVQDASSGNDFKTLGDTSQALVLMFLVQVR